MVVLLSFLLTNILCAYTPCFPTFDPPTPKVSPDSQAISLRSGNLGLRKRDAIPPTVRTKNGDVKGYTMKTIGGRDIFAFEGIPFAEAPVGNLRFRNPVPKKWMPGIVNSIPTLTKNCIQTDLSRFFAVTGNEDCLYLNVYTPNVDELLELPVVIFFYGGAFLFGSKDQYGPAYMLDKDMILVTVNYRVGALGFLSTGDQASPGNFGLKDQSLALNWVTQNIDRFGGDPNKITLMGQSAGGASVHLHMMSRLSRGKFIRGIAHSASAFCSWGITRNVETNSKKLGKFLGCPTKNSTALVECLRTIPSNTLTATQTKIYEWLNFPSINFGPTVEKYKDEESFLTESPESHYARGDLDKVPLIIGFVPNEGNVYNILMMLNPLAFPFMNVNFDRVAPMSLEYRGLGLNEKQVSKQIREYYFGNQEVSHRTLKQHADMYGDRFLMAGIHKAMEVHSKVAPTFGYYFNYFGEFGILQRTGMTRKEAAIAHYDDVQYFLNSTQFHKSIDAGTKDAVVSEFVIDLWANFITSGEPKHTLPDGKLVHIWDKINPNNISVLEINTMTKMVPFPRQFLERINFWKSLGLAN